MTNPQCLSTQHHLVACWYFLQQSLGKVSTTWQPSAGHLTVLQTGKRLMLILKKKNTVQHVSSRGGTESCSKHFSHCTFQSLTEKNHQPSDTLYSILTGISFAAALQQHHMPLKPCKLFFPFLQIVHMHLTALKHSQTNK